MGFKGSLKVVTCVPGSLEMEEIGVLPREPVSMLVAGSASTLVKSTDGRCDTWPYRGSSAG
jgi:hypothetical protein